MKGFNNVDKKKWFIIGDDEEERVTRARVTIEEGNREKREWRLYKPPARCELRNNFFTVQTVRPWNELPESVKAQKTVNGFKSAYDRWKQKGEIEKRQNTQNEETAEEDDNSR